MQKFHCEYFNNFCRSEKLIKKITNWYFSFLINIDNNYYVHLKLKTQVDEIFNFNSQLFFASAFFWNRRYP